MSTKGTMASALLAVSAGAVAQEVGPTSNTDLRAAYCIGVEQQAHSLFDSPAASGVPVASFVSKSAQERLQHPQAYLVPRMSYIDPLGVTAVCQRGLGDMQFIQRDQLLATCIAKCPTPIEAGEVDEFRQCMVSCDSERFPRVWRCNDLSWLPF